MSAHCIQTCLHYFDSKKSAFYNRVLVVTELGDPVYMSVEDFSPVVNMTFKLCTTVQVQYRCADVLNLLNNVLHDIEENQ